MTEDIDGEDGGFRKPYDDMNTRFLNLITAINESEHRSNDKIQEQEMEIVKLKKIVVGLSKQIDDLKDVIKGMKEQMKPGKRGRPKGSKTKKPSVNSAGGESDEGS